MPHSMFHEKAIDIGAGHHVAVREYPDNGPPLVMLHGAGLNVILWEPLAEILVDSYHLVAIDLLGHGASSMPESYSLQADLDAVETVIAALGLVRPAILGHSYGGMIAVVYAGRHPDCPVVINVDGLGGQSRLDHYHATDEGQLGSFIANREASVWQMIDVADRGSRTWVEQEVARALAEDPELPRRALSAMTKRSHQPEGVDEWVRMPRNQFFGQLISALFHLDLFAAYRSAQCPVLLVLATKESGQSEADASFMAAYLECLARAFPTLAGQLPTRRVVTLETGHIVPLEAPLWLASLVRQSVLRS